MDDNENKIIERLNNIINEQEKELELERNTRRLLINDFSNVCDILLEKYNIINKAIEILDIYGTSNYETADLLYSVLRGKDK